ncbi:hypothetical protein D3C84_372130 [compost metagenome]
MLQEWTETTSAHSGDQDIQALLQAVSLVKGAQQVGLLASIAGAAFDLGVGHLREQIGARLGQRRSTASDEYHAGAVLQQRQGTGFGQGASAAGDQGGFAFERHCHCAASCRGRSWLQSSSSSRRVMHQRPSMQAKLSR